MKQTSQQHPVMFTSYAPAPTLKVPQAGNVSGFKTVQFVSDNWKSFNRIIEERLPNEADGIVAAQMLVKVSELLKESNLSFKFDIVDGAVDKSNDESYTMEFCIDGDLFLMDLCKVILSFDVTDAHVQSFTPNIGGTFFKLSIVKRKHGRKGEPVVFSMGTHRTINQKIDLLQYGSHDLANIKTICQKVANMDELIPVVKWDVQSDDEYSMIILTANPINHLSLFFVDHLFKSVSDLDDITLKLVPRKDGATPVIKDAGLVFTINMHAEADKTSGSKRSNDDVGHIAKKVKK